MKERYYSHISLLTFGGHLICILCVIFGLSKQLSVPEIPKIVSLAPITLGVLSLAFVVPAYLKYKDSVIFFRVVAVTFSLTYTVMLLLSPTVMSFPYMTPYLFCMLLSMDAFSVNLTSMVFLVVNIIKIVMTVMSTESLGTVVEQIGVQGITVVLVTIAVVRGLSNLTHFFNSSLEEVQVAAEKNRAVSEKITEVALEISNQLGIMGDSVEAIRTSTQAANTNMNSISAGVADAAKEAGYQADQTTEIQQTIDGVYESASVISDISGKTKESLSEGTSAMDRLFDQVKVAANIGNSMEESSLLLKENTEAVRGITDIILSISSQTNLLALNASIEAARAGEAGKGFAVVADEIRNLAEQTKTETENITRIIDTLSENSDSVLKNVADNTRSAEQVDAFAREAASKLEAISEMMQQLEEQITEINSEIASLRDSNNEIVDSVANLSASSERISENSREAVELTENNAGMVDNFAQNMEKINALIKELNALQN